MEHLKEQNQKNMKEQEKQIENRIKAEVAEGMDALAEQNREMKDKMEQMGQDMKEKNHEIKRIKVLFFCRCFDFICSDLFCFDFICIYNWFRGYKKVAAPYEMMSDIIL